MNARIILKLSLLLVLLSTSLSSASALSGLDRFEQRQAAIDAYAQRFSLAKAVGGVGDLPAIEITQKCGLAQALELRALVDKHGTISGYEEALTRPTTLTESFDSPGGHFKVHYTLVGRDKIDESYGDHNANSVPDYIDIVARVADSVWAHHIDELGYIEPLNDADYGGGDERYDIYVLDVGSNVYGSTVPEALIHIGSKDQATSYMEIDTHYEVYQTYENNPIAALQVTVAHEFFHALHLTYDALEPCTDPGCSPAGQNPYWLEMSAVWIEEDTYDDVNDYYNYLPFYLPTIHNAPYYISNDGLNIYGAGVFPLFLAEKFGSSIIRLIWENCGNTPRENFFSGALQDAVAEASGGTVNLDELWTEYSRWLFYTGGRARTGRYFSEAANYAMVPDSIPSPMRAYIRYYSEYPITFNDSRDNQFRPSELGINYLVFRTGSLDTAFAMEFSGSVTLDPTTEWRKSVIAYDRFNANGNFKVHESTYPLNTPIHENEIDAITDILVIPTIINPELKKLANPYTFQVSDSSVTLTEDNVRFANTKFEIAHALDRPFSVIFDLAKSAVVDVSVFTVAGERVYQSAQESVEPGDPHAFTWNGLNEDKEEVASGVYIVQARIGSEVRHQKILVVR